MFIKILVFVDRVLNRILNGSFDETLSSRAYRMSVSKQPYWSWTQSFIDWLFFWQPNHCQTQFEYEQAIKDSKKPTA